VCAQPARRLVTVEPRHHDVEDGEVGLALERSLDGFLAVARPRDLVAGPFEAKRDESQDVRVVVGDQDERLGVLAHSATCSALAAFGWA
jgi:hypothetical protein